LKRTSPVAANDRCAMLGVSAEVGGEGGPG